jgi:hypothetical protein
MTLPSALTNHDDLMRRIASDLVDSYDEEIELELEDRSLDELEGRHVTDRAERQAYFKELFRLQGELVKLQDWVQHTRKKVVILFEGRDAAGKGGVIKRITQRLNPRVAGGWCSPELSPPSPSSWSLPSPPVLQCVICGSMEPLQDRHMQRRHIIQWGAAGRPLGTADITMRARAGRQRQQDPGPARDRGEQARRRWHAARAGAADSPADGYTLAQIPLGVFRLPYTTKINWDPVKDISYVLNVTGYAFGMVVPADSPLKTWTHFVAWAKANPGKLSYGSTGTMTSPHLTMELIAQKLGMELLHVPYKGSADLMQAILGGQLMAAADSTGFAPQVEAGKLRVLNTWGAERLAKFPDAPTLKELGLDLVQNSPFGIGAPKGTPAPVVKRLHDAFKQAMEQESYKPPWPATTWCPCT